MQNKGDALTSDAKVVPITTDAGLLALITLRAVGQSCEGLRRRLASPSSPSRKFAKSIPAPEEAGDVSPDLSNVVSLRHQIGEVADA